MDSSVSSGTAVCLALVVGCAILAGATGAALATAPMDGSLEDATGIDDSTDEVADDDDEAPDDETVDDETVDDETPDEDDSTVNEDDAVDETTDTTEDSDDEASSSVDDAVNDTSDAVDGTTDEVNETSDTVDDATGSVDNTTDGLNETSDDLDETTETVRNATDETIDGLEETADETAGEIDDAANETAGETDSLLEDPVDSTTDALVETVAEIEDGVSATVSAAASIQVPGIDAPVATMGDDEPALEAIAGGEPTAPGPAQSATDAMLVGLMGAMTASAGAAGGIGGAGGAIGGAGGAIGGAGTASGAGAAAGAGTAAGAGIAGGASGAGAAGGAGTASGGGLTATASNAVANWSATGRRSLRRVLAAIPWELVPVLKYSRYDDSDPLESETRNAIYETVEADPGRYLSQISDEVDVPLSTVRHHVRILEDEGLLTTAKINGKRRYYLEETDSELRAALEEPAKRDVLEALAALERANNSELAAELDRDPSTVTHHLSTLEDDGLVLREREGRSVVNELATETSAALFEDGNTTLEDPSPQAPAD